MAKTPRRLLLVVMMCWLLSGCAPGDLLGGARDPVTLRLGYRQHTVQLENLINAFQEEHPWITVELVEVERYGGQLHSRVRAGAVDLFRDDRSALGLAREGLLLPLDELPESDWADIVTDYYPGAWEGFVLDGRQWGVPAAMDFYVVYAQREAMEALGLPVPSPGWTVLEFTELAAALNHPEGLPYAPESRLFGYCALPDGMDAALWVYLFGGSIVDDLEHPTRATLNDPATMEAIQWFTALHLRYGITPDPQVVRRAFPTGNIYEAQVRGACGLWLGFFGNRGGLDSPYRWMADYYMLPPPQGPVSMSAVDLEGWFVYAETEHPTEALLLVRYLADRWESAGRRIPPRRSLALHPDHLRAVGEEAAVLIEGLPERLQVVPHTPDPGLERAVVELYRAIEQVYAGEVDVYSALEEAQRRVGPLGQP